MIPTNPSVIKKLQAQAERNIARGDWEDDFGLPDKVVPVTPRTSPVSRLLDRVGQTRVTKK